MFKTEAVMPSIIFVHADIRCSGSSTVAISANVFSIIRLVLYLLGFYSYFVRTTFFVGVFTTGIAQFIAAFIESVSSSK